MPQDFNYFEQGIARAARQLPDMPRERVLLNRRFFFVFRELERIHDRLLKTHGLNTSSFLALAMLLGCKDNRLNPRDLSDALDASRTNVTRLTDDLVAAGWVTRNRNDDDRRRVDLSLTDVGRARFLEVLPVVWRLIERQWHGFDPSEMVEFDRLLRKMQHGLARIDPLS